MRVATSHTHAHALALHALALHNTLSRARRSHEMMPTENMKAFTDRLAEEKIMVGGDHGVAIWCRTTAAVSRYRIDTAVKNAIIVLHK
jgi:hypothetical protein